MPIQQFYFDSSTHQSFPDRLYTLVGTTAVGGGEPLRSDITWRSFSSSGSFRKCLVLVESSFRSTRKSFWDSMISAACLSRVVCRVERSMSLHFERAC